MNKALPRWTPWVLPVLTLILEALGCAAAFGAAESASVSLAVSFAVAVSAFAVVGGLISSRHPANAIGWLSSVIGLLFAVVVVCSAGARWGLRGGHLSPQLWEWVAIGSNAWVLALGLIGTQLLVRLPDGALPSPRWRWFSRLTTALIALSLTGMATTPGAVEEVAGTSNPIAWTATEPLAYAFLLVVLCFPVAIAALFSRYRRSSGRDRAQLRWIAFSGAVFVVVYAVSIISLAFVDEESLAGILLIAFDQVAFAALPVGIGYAVLRHNLYDIDLVINRALVYGSLTATLAATYVGSVLLLQLALAPLTDGSGLVVAASTLAVAALFRPARSRIQHLVDRRFFRSRYDAARTVEAFAAHLRDEVDLGELTTDLQRVVVATMRPAQLSTWLRDPEVRP